MSWKVWEHRGKRGLTRAFTRVLRARGERTPELPDLADLERVLLIRQQNQLGDMLLSTPLFRAIRRRAPQARIDLVSGLSNHDAVLGNAHLDEVILYDKRRYLRRPTAARRFANRLRDPGYDLVLVVSTVAFSVTDAWLAALSRSRLRVGRPGPREAGREIASDLYHHVLPEPLPGRHQSAVNLDLGAALGTREEDWHPEIFLSETEEKEGRRLLAERSTGPGLRVVLHPGAGKLPNRWPAERFGRLAAALRSEGHQVVAAAGPGERGLLDVMDRSAGAEIPRIPPTDFRTLGGVFRAADLFVANDTGVLHLAASTGTPGLALFGPTDPLQWCPATPGVRYVTAPGGDLRRLDEEDGIEAAVALARVRAGGGGDPPGSPAPGRS